VDDDQVKRTIEALEVALADEALVGVEQGLAQDDPVFLKRFHAHYRAEIATVVTVFVLLATGAVLLTVGVATTSWVVWVAGVVAFLASFAVDEHHKHSVRRNP
jgi:small-conductance mechanosensitive channel